MLGMMIILKRGTGGHQNSEKHSGCSQLSILQTAASVFVLGEALRTRRSLQQQLSDVSPCLTVERLLPDAAS